MSSPRLTITISDPEFIRRMASVARTNKIGRNQFTRFVKSKVLEAARRAVGLGDDMTPREAADYLGCHVNTIFNYHKAGRFPHAYYLSARKLRFPLRDVEAIKQAV